MFKKRNRSQIFNDCTLILLKSKQINKISKPQFTESRNLDRTLQGHASPTTKKTLSCFSSIILITHKMWHAKSWTYNKSCIAYLVCKLAVWNLSNEKVYENFIYIKITLLFNTMS